MKFYIVISEFILQKVIFCLGVNNNKISTHTLTFFLCFQPGQKPSVKEIAVRQDIPATYLEKLLIEMRRGGLVVSFRGAHGGYQLAKLPAQISLGEILESVGETIEPFLKYVPNPSQAEDWVTYCIWNRMHKKLSEALYNISLEDLYYDEAAGSLSQYFE